jgi:hypothetical protein
MSPRRRRELLLVPPWRGCELCFSALIAMAQICLICAQKTVEIRASVIFTGGAQCRWDGEQEIEQKVLTG